MPKQAKSKIKVRQIKSKVKVKEISEESGLESEIDEVDEIERREEMILPPSGESTAPILVTRRISRAEEPEEIAPAEEKKEEQMTAIRYEPTVSRYETVREGESPEERLYESAEREASRTAPILMPKERAIDRGRQLFLDKGLTAGREEGAEKYEIKSEEPQKEKKRKYPWEK